jgi:hypothetical protein
MRNIDGPDENLDDRRNNVINDVSNTAECVVATNVTPSCCMKSMSYAGILN